MRTAKVITTEISGRGNKIHQYGEIVRENQFAAGNFDRLVKGGYLKEEPQAAAPDPDPQDNAGGNDDASGSNEENKGQGGNQSKKEKKENRFNVGSGKKK